MTKQAKQTQQPGPRGHSAPECLARIMRELGSGNTATFGDGGFALTINASARRFLERLQVPDEHEIAEIWTSLRRACPPGSSFEVEAEQLIRMAILALYEVTHRPKKAEAEVRQLTKDVLKAATKLAGALRQHDDYVGMPSGELWNDHDLEVAIGQYMDTETLDSASLVLRANSPTMSDLVERLASRAQERMSAREKATKPGRAGARITRFRELILKRLPDRLNIGRPRVVRFGMGIRLDVDFTNEVETIAHNITSVAFYEPGVTSNRPSKAATKRHRRRLKAGT